MYLYKKNPLFCVFFFVFLLCCSLNSPLYAAQETKDDKTEHVEALTLKNPILVPISAKSATAHAKSLQKARQGMESWMELADELQNSLKYTRAQGQDARAIEHNGKKVTFGEITASLELLQKLLPKLDKNPELLAQHFVWLKVAPQIHFTSYFSPVIEASYEKNEEYQYPLYRLPNELAPHLAQCLPKHTCPDTAFTKVIRPDPPYHSRVAIDMDGALAGKELEMAWVKHPFDAYSLMLQGSGVLAFADGSTRAILFAGLNGDRGTSMAGYLIQTKQIPRSKASMKGLRAWWDGASAEQRRDFLTAASGYAFFRFGAPTPQGTIGSAMTPWVSMATDPRVIPLGAIVAYHLPTRGKVKAGVVPAKKNVDRQVLRGLGFAQDTGGAIQMRRIDMYAGYGDAALTKAKSVYNKGQAWLLLKKPEEEKKK